VEEVCLSDPLSLFLFFFDFSLKQKKKREGGVGVKQKCESIGTKHVDI
jgi:hypothetical protein